MAVLRDGRFTQVCAVLSRYTNAVSSKETLVAVVFARVM